MFEYDTRFPLDVQEHGRQERDGIFIHDISYASPLGGRVTAYLLAPQSDGPDTSRPCPSVLFMHPSGTGRYAFMEEASVYARSGCVALLLDAPHARQPQRPLFRFTEQDRDELTQCVIDLRRGLDLLSARPGVDARRESARRESTRRFGFVGFSYGATVGALLAGVEKRCAAYVLWGGGARLSEFLRSRAQALPKTKLDAYVGLMEELDALRHVGQAAPSALLFQNGRSDKSVPRPQATALHEAAGEPKHIAWYDAGHALNGPACLDRYEWLRARLDLAPLSPALAKRLSQFKLKQMRPVKH